MYTNESLLVWRDGRVVECGGLENRLASNPGYGGSNPPLSASYHTSARAGDRTSNLACLSCPVSNKALQH